MTRRREQQLRRRRLDFSGEKARQRRARRIEQIALEETKKNLEAEHAILMAAGLLAPYGEHNAWGLFERQGPTDQEEPEWDFTWPE